MKELPLPIIYNDEKITHYEVKRPGSEELAKANDTTSRAGSFEGFKELIKGGIAFFKTDKEKIYDKKNIIGQISGYAPYPSAEAIVWDILIELEPENWIRQYFLCDLCETKRIIKKDDGFLYRDLNIEIDDNVSDYDGTYEIELEYPITHTNKANNEVLFSVSSIIMNYTTLNNASEAYSKFPREDQDAIRRLKSFELSLIGINGERKDPKFIRGYGNAIMKKLDKNDLLQIARKLRKYGVQKTLKITCHNCGNEMEEPVNMSNFFASALQEA
jgi:hypothetical protein